MSNDSTDLVRLLAKLYYVDELDQGEVAQIAGLSRSQVSRLLARARQMGVVRISVEEYVARNVELEDRLTQVLHLNHAVVVRAPHPAVSDSVRRAVGYFAAPFVSELIRPGTVLGVAGGRTITELARSMKAVNETEGFSVVQLMGNVGPNASHTDAIEISSVLARNFRGIYYRLNAPAFALDPSSRHVFLAHQDVQSMWQLFDRMQIALVGIGTLRNSLFVARGTLRAGEIEQLTAQGAVGEICGHFFDRNGVECDTEFRDRVISIELDALSRCAEVVAVTHGVDRAQATVAALAGGLIKSLVIDEAGARAVLVCAER